MDLPSHINRYEIIEVIGQGGMGVVYKARDPNIGRQVALKVIKPALASDSEMAEMMRERFRREAQAAGMLGHPNIITVYDAGEHDGQPFIAMEYVEGRPLDSILDESPLSMPGQAASLILPLANALDFAHNKGIIHRDIKPANIIVADDDTAKLMDFGIARTAGSNLTQTGSLLGSPNYMSPEQITGQDVDGRTDVFSMGVVLYQMLTGERPFLGENANSITFKVVRVDPVAPSHVNPSIDPKWDSIIAKALAKRPDDRYASALALAGDLELMSSGRSSEIEELETGCDNDTRVIPPLGKSGQVSASGETNAIAGGSSSAGSAPDAADHERPPEIGLKDVGTLVTGLTRQFSQKAGETFRKKSMRRTAVVLLVILAVAVIVWGLYGRDPRERAAEYMEAGKHEKAAKVLAAITKENPRDHQAFFKLGAAYAMAGEIDAGLTAYSTALAMDPAYKDDPALVESLLFAPRGEKAEAAIIFINKKAEGPVNDVLEKALSNPSYNVHWNAYDALQKRGIRKDVLPLLILDLETNPDCEVRKQAVIKMGELGDKDALPALRSAKDRKWNGDSCMGDAIDNAVKEIESSKSGRAGSGKKPLRDIERGLRKLLDR